MAPIKILMINPNTNQSMTDTLRAPIESLAYNNVQITPSDCAPDASHPDPHQICPTTPLSKPRKKWQQSWLTPEADRIHIPNRPLRHRQHQQPRRYATIGRAYLALHSPLPSHPPRVPGRVLLPPPSRRPPQRTHAQACHRHPRRKRAYSRPAAEAV